MASLCRPRVLASCLLFSLVCFVSADVPHRTFQYKYSFKGPYLAQRDGSVPFWQYFGSAIASEESVRITPSLRSKKGSIWTKNMTSFDWWEVELVFRITGRGRIGADGLAFWYTAEQGIEGPVFGSNDQWKGLGIFLDSFDNDNRHNNPYVMAIVNDGSKAYDHQNDGAGQFQAGCLRDYRNKPYPVRLKIEYYRNTLTLLYHNGMTDNDADYELCYRAENILLPKFGHFGISAATGGLADDHDVLKCLVTSLTPPEVIQQLQQQQAISDAEKEKLAREFEEYRQKLEQQKEDFRKQNPEAAAKAQEWTQQEGEWFETQQQRELQQIFQGQSQIGNILRELHRKMDELIGRQERALTLLSAVQSGVVPGQPGMPPAAPQVPLQQHGGAAGDTIRRHEVDAILNNQREMGNIAREIKNFVTAIHQKSINAQQQPGQQVTDTSGLLTQARDDLAQLRRDTQEILKKQEEDDSPCPTVTGCLTPTIFLVFSGIQLILMLGYCMYRDSKQAQAKKFY